MSTPAEKASQASDALEYPGKGEGYYDRLAKYRADLRDVQDQFERDLAQVEHTLSGVPETLKKVFEYAWLEGHVEGYRRVQEVYEEIADIVEAALDEAR